MADIMQIPERYRVELCKRLIEEVAEMQPFELAALLLETMSDEEVAHRLSEIEYPDRVVN